MISHASQVLSTASVQQHDAADYWVDIICNTFVQLSAQQVTKTGFQGKIHWEKLGEIEFSTVTASAQDVFRTKEFLSAASEEYLLFSIQRQGTGYVVQDGKTASLKPGSMAIYDSSRPYSLHFPAAFQQLVVQVPKAVIGSGDTRGITAAPHQMGTPEAVVAQLLVSMNDNIQQGGNALGPLKDTILGAIGEIVQPPKHHGQVAAEQFDKSHLMELLRADLANPCWTVDKLADQSHMSKRTVYRMFCEQGPAAVMRSMRIDEAQRLLGQEEQPLVATVAYQCGFDSESGFIRAFHAATGMTPSEYVANTKRRTIQ